MRKKPSISPIVLLVLSLALLPALLAAQQGQKPLLRLKVAADEANLREKPDIGSAIVQQIKSGTILEAERKQGEWYFVHYILEDGGVLGGFIHESLVIELNGNGKAKETAPEAVKTPSPAAARPAVQAAAWKNRVRTGFEISMSIGPAMIEPDDLNDGARGFADYQAAAYSTSYPEDIHKLKYGGSFTFDIGCRVSPTLYVGISAGTILINKKASSYEASFMGIPEQPNTVTISMDPGLRVHPLEAVVRYYPANGFYIRAGLGYYVIKTEYLYQTALDSVWRQWAGEASAACFGGSLALGGELKLSRKWTLFGEAGFRMSSTDSLDGHEAYTDSENGVVLTKGPLWFYQADPGTATRYDQLFISEEHPAGEGISGVRRAKVNASGAVLRIGARVRF